MDFSEICRTCVKTYNNNDLNPIFLSEDTHERFSSAFYSCTGVEVKLKDGLPQNMCTACMKQFNNTLKFRKQCKLAETQLLRLRNELESDNCTFVTNHEQVTEETPSIEQCLTMRIKSEHVNIKNEPLKTDIEEHRPLKYYVERKIDEVMLHKSSDDNESNTDNSDAEMFNEESTELYKNENDVKTDRILPKNAQDLKCKILPLTNVIIEHNLNSIPETLCNSNVAEEKIIDIPYVVTVTDTKKTTRVVCKLCQKELSIRSIDSHMMRRHPGADERKVKCELCDRYVMRDKLNRHRVMMHGSVGVKCGYCKSDFKSKEVLVDHVSTCTAKNRKRKVNDSGRALAECDICKMTMQRASLTKHKAVKHAGLRPVCEHCGKSFGNKFRLNEHYRAKHGYEKFQCRYCDFKSAGIMAMRNHERRHRGEKPFVCETCGAKFHAAYLLMQHKHSHKTEKLVKCDLCPAIFKANNNLHMHKLTCHSKSYYSCTLCARSYKCRYYAVKHVRLAHHVSEAPDVIKLMTQ